MSKKVLIVDDEPDAVRMMEMRLLHEGYEVLKAYGGTEAIKIARKEHPDLILMDILMPAMDGAKAAEALRELPETKDIPVIFVTCLFTKEDAMQETIRGGTLFVAKPYDPEEFTRIVRENIS